jgi:hypothetical protein
MGLLKSRRNGPRCREKRDGCRRGKLSKNGKELSEMEPSQLCLCDTSNAHLLDRNVSSLMNLNGNVCF